MTKDIHSLPGHFRDTAKPSPFKAHMRVEAFGRLGRVFQVYDRTVETIRNQVAPNKAVEVKFDNGMVETFCADGKLEEWHESKSLEIVKEEPKPPKKEEDK